MINNNPYKNKRIEYHILQSFPVSCLNRDDVGAPKTAMVGGVSRARVSSQCWKRAIRLAMHDVSGVELGSRTKLIKNLVKNECMNLGATEEQAEACGANVSKIFGADEKSDTILFLAPEEIKMIANEFKNSDFDVKKELSAKELEKLLGGKSFVKNAQSLDGFDIALFGRMVAKAPKMNVEAAASFSHAISTHKVTNQIEFFTAVDDVNEDQGSAHMGSLEFNAATYYRYISLDLGQLYESMGGSDEMFPQAISAFTKALYVAVPAARQTTQSGACLWDYVQVLVRKGQGLQLSFETPVTAKNGGFLAPSVECLKTALDKKEKLSGSLFGKIAKFEFGEDENFTIDALIDSIVKSVKE